MKCFLKKKFISVRYFDEFKKNGVILSIGIMVLMIVYFKMNLNRCICVSF